MKRNYGTIFFYVKLKGEVEFQPSVLITFPQSLCTSFTFSPVYLLTHCFVLYFCCQIREKCLSPCFSTQDAMKSLLLSAGNICEIFFSHFPESQHGAFSLKLATRSSDFWCMLRIDCAINIKASTKKTKKNDTGFFYSKS